MTAVSKVAFEDLMVSSAVFHWMKGSDSVAPSVPSGLRRMSASVVLVPPVPTEANSEKLG